MCKLLKKYFMVIFFFTLALVPLGGTETGQKEKVTMKLMDEILKEHYSGGDFNPTFSTNAFNLYLKNLDYYKRFLLKEDIDNLGRFETQMGEDFLEADTSILDASRAIMNKRIKDVRLYGNEILAKPFDLNENETVEFNPKKLDYCTTVGEEKEFLRKYLKYEVLQQYLEVESEKSNEDVSFQPDVEKSAREKVSKSFNQMLDRMLDEKEEDQFYRYLNVIAETFDPHTSFMSPIDKTDFDMTISGTFEGIGAQLKEEGDVIKVQEIIPGSAAWRQNILKSGDIILKVGQSTNEPTDIANMVVKDVVKLIRGPKGTEVRLTVKKPDGRIKIIPIVRDKVVLEDTYVRSDIINDANTGKKYGYIYLPLFYRDFNNKDGRNASDDMKKELENLKNENVSGIILDLRNNGGGALEDAIRTAGLFIKNGPVVQVRDGRGRSRVYMDPDPDIVYTGPLVVMINSFSASASEIVAAALQDYGRAVILGDRTFGKGTVQQPVDLDSLLLFNDLKPLGSVKLTVQKFYRINGDSTQLKGVTGDIPLPDPYSVMDMGESSMDYPLPWDSTRVLSYSKWDASYNIDVLRAKSRERVGKNEIFNLIASNSQIMKQEMDNPKILQLSRLMNEQKIAKELGDRINRLLEGTNFFTASIPEGEKEEGDYGDRKDKMESYLKSLVKDIYADEAFNVLRDMNGESR